MSRFLSLFAVVLFAGPVRADAPASVADLVKQLGDERFAKREAAQKELLRRGDAIVPDLDRLGKTADAETAERLRKIRYELVGYKDDILQLLAEVHEGKDSAPVPVSAWLRGLIAKHQPQSGDLLLSILADPKHPCNRKALRAFVSTWDVATPDQIDAYVRQRVTLTTSHRPKLPAKVGAMISFEAQLKDGWTGWPNLPPIGFTFRTRTTRYLDGKPYEKPFDYSYPFATVGWYRVGELSKGKHTISAVMEYEIVQRGERRKGEIRSKDSTFEVVTADTPDDLIAPRSEALTKQVRANFVIREGEVDVRIFTGYTVRPHGVEYDWSPQVTWQAKPGVMAGIHCPVRLLSAPLDVDLCFDAEIHDVKTGTVYPADPVIVRAGEAGRSWIVPRDVRAFAKGRDGFVPVKVVLKPSRALALTDPAVKRYYPDPITTDALRMKVYQKVEVLP
ncbi:MAG TPA: hypothetical protein VKD90_00580 [Gemmataceae bacterium]|nr:hypothetical protein [Gemmataceae bacterium]